MPLLFVTSNVHKFAEVSAVLGEHGIALKHENFQFHELESDSLATIARDKAEQAFQKFRVPLIVEDTGVFLDAYPGFPGVHAKWVIKKIGFPGLFKLLLGKKKTGVFRTSLCYRDAQTAVCFSAAMPGKFLGKVMRQNEDCLPYDKVFIPRGKEKAVVQLSPAEKNAFSQRGKAARAFADWHGSGKKGLLPKAPEQSFYDSTKNTGKARF